MSKKTHISCEFFPPRNDESLVKLSEAAQQLGQLDPDFFSVTYGAGGSDQNKTLTAVEALKSATEINSAPHITCVGSSKASIDSLLESYQAHGINHLVALRGDIPSGMLEPGEFLHASDLVTYIRETTGDHFSIDVACYPEAHPEASTPEKDIEHFVEKFKAGANGAITQYFYNTDAYFYFLDQVEKHQLDIPIVPGIMPITNYKGLVRFSDSCGACIPRWIKQRLETYQHDSESLHAFGLEVVTNMCQKLLDDGAPGLHFYTMNKSEPTRKIWDNLTLG